MSPKEEKLLEAWTRDSVANERDRLKTIKAKAIKDIEGQQSKAEKHYAADIPAPPLVDKKRASSSTSKSAPKAAKNAASENLEEANENAAGLLSFFGAKAI